MPKDSPTSVHTDGAAPCKISFFSRYCKVMPGEGRQVLAFALFAILLQSGMTIGMAAGDAVFLNHLGADKLWLVFILTPLLMAILTPGYATWLQRHGINRLAEHTFVVLVIFGVLIAWAVAQAEGWPEGLRQALFVGIKLYAAVWYILLYTLFWNFTDSYFTIQDAKRLFPLFSAGMALGSIFGAGLVTLLAAHVPMAFFFFLWAVLALVTLPLLVFLKKRFQPLADTGAKEDTSTGRGPTSMLGALLNSPFSLILAGVLFVTLILTNLIEYQYFEILGRDRDAAELAVLFGLLYALSALFNLVVNLFLYSRLVVWLGIRTLMLVMPLVYLLTFAVLFITDHLWAAVLAFWAYHGVLTSLEYNTQNILFNAVPGQYKKSIRTYIEGLVEPSASLFSGLFLLIAVPLLDPRSLAGIALLVTVVLIGLALLLRHHYRGAMAANIQTLAKQHAAGRIPHPGAQEGHALLTQHTKGGAKTMERWVTLCLAAEWHGLQGLDQQQAVEAAHAGLISTSRAVAWLNDTTPHLRAAAALTLWHLGDVRYVKDAVQTLHQLAQGATHERILAIQAYGCMGDPLSLHALKDALDSHEPDIRHAALKALQGALRHGMSTAGLGEKLLDILAQEDSDGRLLAIDCLGMLEDPRLVLPMLQLADRLRPTELQRLEHTLTHLGIQVLLPTMRVLADTGFGHRTRSLAANLAARIDLNQAIPLFESIMDEELERGLRLQTYAQQLAYHLASLHSKPPRALALLHQRLTASAKNAGLRVIELAALSGRLPSFASLDQALCSHNPKDRANALETIEQGLSKQQVIRLIRLLEADASYATLEPPLSGAASELAAWLANVLETAELDPLETAVALVATVGLVMPERARLPRYYLLHGNTPLVRQAAALVLAADNRTAAEDCAEQAALHTFINDLERLADGHAST